MEPMTLDELMTYWYDKAEDIAFDESLNYKDRYYKFVDAYSTYLFYFNVVNTNEIYEEAKGEAKEYGITEGMFE